MREWGASIIMFVTAGVVISGAAAIVIGLYGSIIYGIVKVAHLAWTGGW